MFNKTSTKFRTSRYWYKESLEVRIFGDVQDKAFTG